MKIFAKYLSVFVLISILLGGCKKDEPQNILTSPAGWEIDRVELNIDNMMGILTAALNLTSEEEAELREDFIESAEVDLDTCAMDEFLIFMEDGNFVQDAGDELCFEGQTQRFTGTWTLTNDNETLTLLVGGVTNSFQIDVLTEDDLALRLDQTFREWFELSDEEVMAAFGITTAQVGDLQNSVISYIQHLKSLD